MPAMRRVSTKATCHYLQGRKLAVLACMDARLDPQRILGLQEVDAYVIRNAGVVVSDDAIRQPTRKNVVLTAGSGQTGMWRS